MLIQKKLEKESIYFFLLHIINVTNKYTINEMRLLAKIMSYYPRLINSELRSEIGDSMKIKKAYISQLIKSLKNKGVLEKRGNSVALISKVLINFIKNINENKGIDVSFKFELND